MKRNLLAVLDFRSLRQRSDNALREKSGSSFSASKDTVARTIFFPARNAR
jgi:hypothetical protein